MVFFVVFKILIRKNRDFSKVDAGSGERCLFDCCRVKIWRQGEGFVLDLGWAGSILERFAKEYSGEKDSLVSSAASRICEFESMETLVAVARHRNYGSRCSKSHDGFISSPSSGFRGINCRTFQSGVGILPAPSHGLASFTSPRPTKQGPLHCHSEPPKQPRRTSPISISPTPVLKGTCLNDELCDSERWAGPAYSNSPPPSSLPIPKFSLRQKRSISLELPGPMPGIEIQPLARSAPASPTRDLCSSPSDLFFNIDSATQDLRRILHLDATDG